MSAYSSDSRPSVIADQDFGKLEWDDAVKLQQLVKHHRGPVEGSTDHDVICKARRVPLYPLISHQCPPNVTPIHPKCHMNAHQMSQHQGL